jgi:hypothetical protein
MKIPQKLGTLRARAKNRAQALLESALILVLSCFMFFGLLQVILVIEGYQVQQWATFAAGRSRIVGFNDVVVQKAWYVANIMNSGAMLAPQTGLNSVQQVAVEQDAIPLFIQSIEPADSLAPQLSYASWKTLPNLPPYNTTEQYEASGKQDYPLIIAGLIPMLGSSIGKTNLDLETHTTFENHFPLYLDVD